MFCLSLFSDQSVEDGVNICIAFHEIPIQLLPVLCHLHLHSSVECFLAAFMAGDWVAGLWLILLWL